MVKVLLGGLLGGIVVFAWGYVSHMVLPLGDMGLSQLENEAAVVDALRDNIDEPGFYIFPSVSKTATEDEEADWLKRFTAGPVGVLAYQPVGRQPMAPRQFVTELVSNVLAAMVAVLVLLQTSVGYFGRVVVVTLMGFFGWVSISVTYWNWFYFNDMYTAGIAIQEVAGWFIAGLFIAGVTGKGYKKK